MPWAGQSQKSEETLAPPHRARHEKFMSCPGRGKAKKARKRLHPHTGHGMKNSCRALGGARPKSEETPAPPHRARHEKFMSRPGRGKAKKAGKRLRPHTGHGMKNACRALGGAKPKSKETHAPPHRARHEKYMSCSGRSRPKKTRKRLQPHTGHGITSSKQKTAGPS